MKAIWLDTMKPVSEQELAGIQSSKRPFWADLSPSETEPLAKLGVKHSVFSEMERSELPLVREFEELLCLLFSEMRVDKILFRERLHVYVTKRSIVTVNGSKHLSKFQNLGLRKATPTSAMCFVLLELVEENEKAVEKIEERIEEIEERIIKKKGVRMDEILSTKRTIFSITKVLWHERDIIFALRHSCSLELTSERLEELDEAHNSILYCIDLTSNFREILTDSLDVYHTFVSNGINESIKKLTVVTVILAIIATVTSIPNTIATIFGIPYFPIKTDLQLAKVLGFEIYPWDIILILLVLGSLIPSLVLFWWWNRINTDSD